MKLRTVLQGQALRFIRLLSPTRGLFVPELIQAIRERYKFTEWPKQLSDYDATKGIAFSHGVFDVPASIQKVASGADRIVIDKITIFTNGISVDTKAYVEEADACVDSVLEWAKGTLGFSVDDQSPERKLFFSMVEVQMDNGLPHLQCPAEAMIASALGDYLDSYGFQVEKYQTVGTLLNIDETRHRTPPIPGMFRIERRAEFPFDANVFLGSAPLTTKDHLALLAKIEAST